MKHYANSKLLKKRKKDAEQGTGCVFKNQRRKDEKKVLFVSCVINIEEVVKHWAKKHKQKEIKV